MYASTLPTSKVELAAAGVHPVGMMILSHARVIFVCSVWWTKLATRQLFMPLKYTLSFRIESQNSQVFTTEFDPFATLFPVILSLPPYATPAATRITIHILSKTTMKFCRMHRLKFLKFCRLLTKYITRYA